MEWLQSMPDWLATAVIGAVFAVIGFAGKSLVDWWQEKRKEHAATIAQLQSLQSLLNASRALFILQQSQVKRLMEMLERNHVNEFQGNNGYEDAMARCHAVLNDEEQELHGIIRAYTEHSLRKVNQAMSDWLKADATFKAGIMPGTRSRELAKALFALEIHLLLWHAKYESWLPGHPEHALVYMADEKAHGLGFPTDRKIIEKGVEIDSPGVDGEVALMLGELRN
jgi:hypothetical protein